MQTPTPTTNPDSHLGSQANDRFQVHTSCQDASVNWERRVDVGSIEARYVRRSADYIVVYLSSQTGCDQGCRMCHLTATGQTSLRNVTVDELFEQADAVLDYYRQHAAPAPAVHYNFMARGEPMANPALLHHADEILSGLAQRAVQLNLRPRYLVSTIMPKDLKERAIEDIFLTHHPEFYYSIYSVDDRFRRRWLPKALPANDALDRLASWQRATYKLCKIHYAFIEGENDSEADVHAICDAIVERRLMVHVNIVRYNPHDQRRHGREPAEDIVQRNAEIFRQRLVNSRVKVIPRVGYDVKASCGMFLGG